MFSPHTAHFAVPERADSKYLLVQRQFLVALRQSSAAQGQSLMALRQPLAAQGQSSVAQGESLVALLQPLVVQDESDVQERLYGFASSISG